MCDRVTATDSLQIRLIHSHGKFIREGCTSLPSIHTKAQLGDTWYASLCSSEDCIGASNKGHTAEIKVCRGFCGCATR